MAALSNRGNVRLALGDPSGAIDDQSASIVLAPEESDPHLNRGTAEEALQDWSAAAEDYLDSGARSAGCLSPLQCAWLARGLAFGARALWPGSCPPRFRHGPLQRGAGGLASRRSPIGRRRNCAN